MGHRVLSRHKTRRSRGCRALSPRDVVAQYQIMWARQIDEKPQLRQILTSGKWPEVKEGLPIAAGVV